MRRYEFKMKKSVFAYFMAATMISASLTVAPTQASAQSNYDAQFVDYPSYAGDDLEMRVDKSGTHFKLWSPKADKVNLHLYNDGRTGEAYKTIAMTFNSADGTWSASVAEQLYGKFYTFQIEQGGKLYAETPGVWAKAVGVNGKRAAAVEQTMTAKEQTLTFVAELSSEDKLKITMKNITAKKNPDKKEAVTDLLSKVQGSNNAKMILYTYWVKNSFKGPLVADRTIKDAVNEIFAMYYEE